MAPYYRHPLYSIGEGIGREKEERLEKLGLQKKKNQQNITNIPNYQKPVVVNKNDIWMPNKILNFDKLQEDFDILKAKSKNLRGKI